MSLEFRPLKAQEIDVRIQSVKDHGAILLLYKDARCDMNVLDEAVGPFNWKREHTRDNRNCIVSIWDEGKEQWISKEDTGTKSYSEAEKGLASDSFKRACFNWGIGRELYTAPFIWVDKLPKENLKYTKFEVKEIDYDENKNITKLVIADTKGNIRFSHPRNYKQQTKQETKPKNEYKARKSQLDKIQELYTNEELHAMLTRLNKNNITQLTVSEANTMIKARDK